MEKKKTERSWSTRCTLDRPLPKGTESVPFLSGPGLRRALSSRYIQLLILLTAAGIFLRFYNLTFNSIWLDEAATYNFSRDSFLEIWNITANGEFNPPLFHWIEHVMLFFGNSEFTLRFIPALLGAFTIPLFYLIGKEMYDRNAGIIAAAILAFSPFHVLYSQDARAYTTVLFFFTIALFFFLSGLKTGKRSDWILFGIFSALSFWTHFYVFIGVVILYAYALYVVGKKKGWNIKGFSEWILSAAVFLIATLPLLAVTVHLFLVRTGSPPTYGAQGLTSLELTFIQFSGFTLYVTIIYLVLFVMGLIQLFKVKKDTFTISVLAVLGTLAASYVLSFVMPMIPRYLIFLLPFFFVPIAASYHIFFRITKTPKIVYILIIVILAINIPQLYHYYTVPSKEDWRGLGMNLAGATQPGDVVVAVPSYVRMPLEYYYSNATDGTILVGASSLGELQAIPDKYPGTTIIYLVTSDISAADPSGASFNWLDQNTMYIANQGGIFVFASSTRG
ncbi:putative membrane protein [Methanolinea mesophila]|uniref:glycosyltransferase family 39 protein n=1 Tax=Methanolinea mesophila TaxID=547055 RepID=UPI001AE55F28|nr:glycosyltransferase family 39 protein [Methanolinea mesophila]MBP1928785.1 putative membrane protein [Methanolinea mesophila]